MKKTIAITLLLALAFLIGLFQAVNLDAVNIRPSAKILLPTNLFATTGIEFNLFYDTVVMSDCPERVLFNYRVFADSSATNGTNMQEGFRWTPTAADCTTNSFKVVAYHEQTAIASKQCALIIKPTNYGVGGGLIGRKVLLIGDSLVSGSEITMHLTNLFLGNGTVFACVGSQGSNLSKQEGRSGRSFDWFMTNSASPFVFSGNLSISNYLSTNSITLTNKDWVIMHLGVNDVFSLTNDATVVTRLNSITNHIWMFYTNLRAYYVAVGQTNPGINFAIVPQIPPSRGQDAFGKSYNAGQTVARYRRNNDLLVNRIIDTFDNLVPSNIYVLPMGFGIDSVYGMPTNIVDVNARNAYKVVRQSDGVHPATNGYWQIGDQIFSFIKCWETN